MNRIILIGNGFDLAHGLKTSYKDFINDYWKDFIKVILQKENTCQHRSFEHKDDLILYHSGITPLTNANPDISTFQEFAKIINLQIDSFIVHPNLQFHNKFFLRIMKKQYLENWVDIENEYYEALKEFADSKDIGAVIKLNSEFKTIEKLLADYLTKIKTTTETCKILEIQEKIFSPLILQDISQKHKKEFDAFVENKVSNLKIERYDKNYSDIEIIELPDFLITYKYSEKPSEVLNQLLKDIPAVAKHFSPNKVLLINFNYTTLIYKYSADREDTRWVHIHGELNNEFNPIIFGYGDELDEDYKKLENLNRDEYMQHIKSMHYHKTGNYRNLLDFMESAPYQVLVMGHSCGNSDRTLLNTLFTHDNCCSIKPYYHEKKDENGRVTDNYMNIVANISRNFGDKKALMRSRVVNQKYCEPLPQHTQEE